MLLVAFCNWLDSLKVKSYDVTIQVRSDLHRTILLFTIFCFQEIIHGGSLKFYILWAVRYSVHFELAVELGGGTPYMMAYIERLHPKELRYERVGLLRVGVCGIMKRRPTVSVRNGHHFQLKVYERSTFSVEIGI